MIFILISLVFNLNAYAESSTCTILVSEYNQATLPSSSFTLESNDDSDSFKITTTKPKEVALQIELSKNGKISAAAGIPDVTIAEINAAYNNKYSNGNIIQTISRTGQGTFQPEKKNFFKIEVDKSTKCCEQDISILLFLIDKWFYI